MHHAIVNVATLQIPLAGAPASDPPVMTGMFSSPPLVIGICHGMLLTLFIWAAAAPSGGHMNPTITMATMMTGHTSVFRALLYFLAQVSARTHGRSEGDHIHRHACRQADRSGDCGLVCGGLASRCWLTQKSQ